MEKIKELEKIIGLEFRRPELLILALTHRSFLNENKKVTVSNERLEFLGDSVLSLLVASTLYQKFPAYPEGKLTSLRSALVRTQTLADLASQINLGKYLQISKGEEQSGGRTNKSLLADTFEAVIGAIYLDQGLAKATEFLEKFLYPKIPEINENLALLDFKSAFQEQTQEHVKASPEYKVHSAVGPDHAKVFTVGVYLQDRLIAQGQGKSKQEAEQAAAKAAIEKGDWRR